MVQRVKLFIWTESYDGDTHVIAETEEQAKEVWALTQGMTWFRNWPADLVFELKDGLYEPGLPYS